MVEALKLVFLRFLVNSCQVLHNFYDVLYNCFFLLSILFNLKIKDNQNEYFQRLLNFLEVLIVFRGPKDFLRFEWFLKMLRVHCSNKDL